MLEIRHVIVALLPYILAGCSIATLAIAFWSRMWPTVKGTIDVSIFDQEWKSTNSDFDSTYEKAGKLHLSYSYSIAGALFQGTRIAPLVEIDWQLTGGSNLSAAHDRAEWYREGAIVEVHYCPYFPKWACLAPGGFFPASALGLATIVAFYTL